MYLNAVLAAIVFLVLFESLENEVETRINRFFFRERYDLETSVVELRRRLAHTLENEEMIQVVIAGLERSRRITPCSCSRSWARARCASANRWSRGPTRIAC